MIHLSIGERRAIRSTLRDMVQEIANANDRPHFVFKEHDLENVMDVLDPDGEWRLRVRQFRNKNSGRVVLYFGGWEFEGLGDDVYTFEDGVLRDSDGEKIEIRNLEPFQHSNRESNSKSFGHALSLVNQTFVESGIQWRVYKADLNFDDGSVPVCYYCDTSKFPTTDPIEDDVDGAERSSLQEVLTWVANSELKSPRQTRKKKTTTTTTTTTTSNPTPKLQERIMKVLVDSRQDCALTSSHVEFSENLIEWRDVLNALREVRIPINKSRNNVRSVKSQEIRGMTLGLVETYSNEVVVSKNTLRRPMLTRLLVRYALRYLPKNFYFTSIQINFNYASILHVDSNNLGPSYIIGLGNFTGTYVISCVC